MRTIVSLHNQAKSENLKNMSASDDMDAIGWLQLHPKLISDIGLGEADMGRLLELRYKSKRAAVPLEAALELAKLDLNYSAKTIRRPAPFPANSGACMRRQAPLGCGRDCLA
jgi:hypothetical protein